MDTPVDGWCEPRFEAVRQAFATNFVERGEVGAAVCVLVDGEVVVDFTGGWTDAEHTRPWQPDTLVNVYSVGKAVVATLLLQLVDQGNIGLDTPLAEVWPEFAVGGKETATVRHALSHQAGVPAIAEPLANDDLWQWDRMAAALAATPAWFEPGSRVVYHTNTYGHLAGETIHRITGRSPGEQLRSVAEPLGADIWFGLPAAEHHRCADVIWAPAQPSDPLSAEALDGLEGESAMVLRGYFNPPGYSSHGLVNLARWRAAQVPSTNGHASARGVARFYQGLVEPGRLLSPDLLAEATRVQAQGPCPVLGEHIAVGLGFVPTSARRPFGPNPRAFGHFGTGGALGFADLDRRVAFGYVMNHVIPRWQSTRNRALIDALYSVL
jgi:CubicO group peptidase (beta-lactamase class C family)